MKKFISILLLVALALVACSAKDDATEDRYSEPTAEAGAEVEEADTPPSQQQNSPQGDAQASGLDGLDTESVDIFGQVAGIGPNGFSLVPTTVYEEDGVAYGALTADQGQPALPVEYTTDAEFGWIYYDQANGNQTLAPATAADVQPGQTVYLWGNEEGGTYYAGRVMIFKVE